MTDLESPAIAVISRKLELKQNRHCDAGGRCSKHWLNLLCRSACPTARTDIGREAVQVNWLGERVPQALLADSYLLGTSWATEACSRGKELWTQNQHPVSIQERDEGWHLYPAGEAPSACPRSLPGVPGLLAPKPLLFCTFPCPLHVSQVWEGLLGTFQPQAPDCASKGTPHSPAFSPATGFYFQVAYV